MPGLLEALGLGKTAGERQKQRRKKRKKSVPDSALIRALVEREGKINPNKRFGENIQKRFKKK